MVSHERDTYSIMSLSDWTMCHGQTYVYMAWTWHVALSNIKASCKLTTISHPVIDSSDIVLSLLLSLQRVHCSHVWVWVMHVGSVDVRVMILQYRRWSVPTTCPSYTHANNINSLTIHFTSIRPTIPEIQLFRNLTLKYPRSRSWVRSQVKVTYYTQYLTNALPFRFTSIGPTFPEIWPK